MITENNDATFHGSDISWPFPGLNCYIIFSTFFPTFLISISVVFVLTCNFLGANLTKLFFKCCDNFVA